MEDIIERVESSQKQKIIAAVVVFLLFFSFIGYAMMFEKIETGEYGLLKNSFTVVVRTDKVFEPELYLVPFHRMLIFPSIFSTIEFKGEGSSGFSIFSKEDTFLLCSILTATTHDGLPVSIELSFQYKIIKDHIIGLYLIYGEEYADYFLRIARDSLRDAAAQFNATEYFYNRIIVGDVMRLFLEKELGTILTAAVTIENEIGAFQLRKTILPETFTQALQVSNRRKSKSPLPWKDRG